MLLLLLLMLLLLHYLLLFLLLLLLVVLLLLLRLLQVVPIPGTGISTSGNSDVKNKTPRIKPDGKTT